LASTLEHALSLITSETDLAVTNKVSLIDTIANIVLLTPLILLILLCGDFQQGVSILETLSTKFEGFQKWIDFLVNVISSALAGFMGDMCDCMCFFFLFACRM
jgi:hypothetical protein